MEYGLYGGWTVLALHNLLTIVSEIYTPYSMVLQIIRADILRVA